MLERVRLGGLSGTYTVKRLELARDRKTRSLSVTVLLLDDSTYTFHVGKRAKGSEVLENVFQHLDLSERDYFGLQFIQQASDVVVSRDIVYFLSVYFLLIKIFKIISSDG